jgi:hypothetical protein
MQDAVVKEARGTYAAAIRDWDAKLARERERHRARVAELLERHRRELRESGAADADPPGIVEATADAMIPEIFHVRRCAGCRRPTGAAGGDARRKRRAIVARHKREILQINAECCSALRDLERSRHDDLARKRAVAGEDEPTGDANNIYCSPPQSPGASVRFVLKVRNF